MWRVLIAMKSELLSGPLSAALCQHDVHTCSLGTDALAQIESLHPQILILDLMPPGMDGITLLQKSGYKPRIILALTNVLNQDVLAKAAAAGIQDVLLIPCTVPYILKRLNILTEKYPSAES